VAPALTILKNFLPVLEAVEICFSKWLGVPALVLTYSGIDAAAWVNSDRPSVDRTAFKDFVSRYLLAAKALPCSPDDLYSARCALLHNLASESDMSKRGAARPIWYAFRQAPLEPLQKAAALPQAPNPIAMRADDLVEAFTLALVALEAELTRSAPGDAVFTAWQTQAKNKAAQVFTFLPWPSR
jgi:hypothetical protein